MDFDSSRRRFLELAGTGTALSLAGCSGLGGDAEGSTTDGSPADESTTDGGPAATDGAEQTDGADRTVAVAVQADQEELATEREAIQSKVQEGELSREEASAEFQSVQERLRSEAIAAVRERIESEGALAIDDAIEEFGLLLVSGSPAALLDTLSYSQVQAIAPESAFADAKTAKEAQDGTPSGE